MSTLTHKLIVNLGDVSMKDTELVGGKNASLGELIKNLGPLGVPVPNGFATTSYAYWKYLDASSLRTELEEILSHTSPQGMADLAELGARARKAILAHPLPKELEDEVLRHYDALCVGLGRKPELAVRSSATAEDLPGASFAGQHATFLNVRGPQELLTAVHECFASLFTDRAIDYRNRNGFDHLKVALSVGVQPMVRSDLGSAGVIFTLDTESGFRDVIVVTGSYGLGETVVQGAVNPDEWTVFKPTLKPEMTPIVGRRRGSKETQLVFEPDSGGTRSEDVPEALRKLFCLKDKEVLRLAWWARLIESHYSWAAGRSQPMDIEWAKDGNTGELFILQARPETVHSVRKAASHVVYRLTGTHGEALVTGQAVGEKIASGRARVVLDPSGLDAVRPGDVLIAKSTDPDWEPVMKRVAGIVTDQGGRTAHAAIVSREIGIPCVVGTGEATTTIPDGDIVTISCAEGSVGRVYPGSVGFKREEIDYGDLPAIHTKVMVNLGDPDQAFRIASLPVAGVGLARMEFIVAGLIGIHPMALRNFPNLDDKLDVDRIAARLEGMDPVEFFVERLSEGLGRICAAFYPRPVIVRTSDFKTNEYAGLWGGNQFEPSEENPMLGFRGASRYYDPRYQAGFELECMALKRVRDKMGLTNMKVMIPFCRTIEEGRQVVATMSQYGLRQGENGLEIYAMCELPANVVEADAFLRLFDGYSIGSNDLTQLTLGIDRDSGTISRLFSEQDPAVKGLIGQAIAAAHRNHKPIGICGQAPSDYPEFAKWLVGQGITSISVNPDSVMKTILAVAEAERSLSYAPMVEDGAERETGIGA